ncbi:MAG: KipI antagonist [Candidatus Accumulibacter appositus]|uniref:KipI antagonist n=1 Tax=Candidatus Accumulibacter appositus TaxID=1454003 RepID=A0A011N8V3_9PROT|nr:biotin-dependent carboxyltransferase family protein [Accumulibacter sp.]EXI79008.1 MAG: KipI antagonist [Candidatus Accumulibacter appositus]HRF03237.1 biotin-dependent carboxyltransferase family protein [Accumulibacter sp.]
MSETLSEIEIRSAGAYASIQDGGRRGLRRVGVPWSGVLDAASMRIANALVGNQPSAPVIEHFDGGLVLKALHGRVRVAVAGQADIDITGEQGVQRVVCWRGVCLGAGETLRIRALRAGRLVVVAVAGLQVAETLGSASTYARAGIGQPLAAGDRLSVQFTDAGDFLLPESPGDDAAPIRVVAGPQAGHFVDQALATLCGAPFTVTDQADRMGVRLRGPLLEHRSEAHKDIISDATVPGSMQVPGSGQPIVLLADAQTVGGYPKIATVISADLGRLANRRAGEILCFELLDVDAAERAARSHADKLAQLIASIRRLPGDGSVDLEALYNSGLISGPVSGFESEE